MSVLCTDLSAGGIGGVSGVFCLDHSLFWIIPLFFIECWY